MTRYTNRATYDYTKFKGETNTLPSLTIPDKSLTVQQIMDRHTRGQMLPFTKSPQFSFDGLPEDMPSELVDLPNFDRMDAVEKAELLAYVNQEIDETQHRMTTRTEKRKKASKDADKAILLKAKQTIIDAEKNPPQPKE